jgi:hypothetical protein
MPDYILLVFSEQWRRDPFADSAIFIRGTDPSETQFGLNGRARPRVTFVPQLRLSQSYLQSIATLVTRNCQNVLSTGVELANEGLRLIVLA